MTWAMRVQTPIFYSKRGVFKSIRPKSNISTAPDLVLTAFQAVTFKSGDYHKTLHQNLFSAQVFLALSYNSHLL